jgi:hypothetical protein
VRHYGIPGVTPIGGGSSTTPTVNTGATFTLGPGNLYKLLDYQVQFPGSPGFYPGNISIEQQFNSSFYAVYHYDATVTPPVGVSDYVQFTSGPGIGPGTFSPATGSPIPAACTLKFCPVNYSAKFYDFDHTGTTASTWVWKIELYHAKGTYALPLPPPFSNPAYSDLRLNSSFTLPPNDWLRDANGDILAKVQVDNVDSDGYGHHAERMIGIKSPPPKIIDRDRIKRIALPKDIFKAGR